MKIQSFMHNFTRLILARLAHHASTTQLCQQATQQASIKRKNANFATPKTSQRGFWEVRKGNRRSRQGWQGWRDRHDVSLNCPGPLSERSARSARSAPTLPTAQTLILGRVGAENVRVCALPWKRDHQHAHTGKARFCQRTAIAIPQIRPHCGTRFGIRSVWS